MQALLTIQRNEPATEKELPPPCFLAKARRGVDNYTVRLRVKGIILSLFYFANLLLKTRPKKRLTILCGCGYNIRRFLRFLIFWLYKNLFAGWFYRSANVEITTQNHF